MGSSLKSGEAMHIGKAMLFALAKRTERLLSRARDRVGQQVVLVSPAGESGSWSFTFWFANHNCTFRQNV